MGPPSSRASGGLLIDPALTVPIPTPANNRDSGSRSAEPTTEEKVYMRERDLIIQKLAEQDKKLTKMAESIDDWKIQNGRLLAAFMRSSSEALAEQDTRGVLETLIDDFGLMVNAAYEARSDKDELEVLRAENDAMKAKLQSIALAMGSGAGDITHASKPLTSPTTASCTSSVLGKRKRVDARPMHSLLQNEVSFTEEDDLHDQSGLYNVSNATNTGSTPARQSERPSTPLSSARVSQQYRQAPTMTTFSNIKPPAAPTVAGQTLAKTAAEVLTPPDSSSAEKHGRNSLSTEPDNLGAELECSSIAAHEVDGSTGEANADSGLGETANSPDVADYQATAIGNAANDGSGGPSRITQPRRARKPTPKVAATTDTEGAETAVGLAEKQQNSEAIELQSRGMGASPADVSRRKTTSDLPQEFVTEQENDERNNMKSQRRRTTNALPEEGNVDIRDRCGSSNGTRPQRMTRATASQFDYARENGYGEVSADMTEEGTEEDFGQSMSLMTDEEPEELFQPSQADRYDMQMNGNNKENQQPAYATSADSTQSKQPYRRNRDHNKPKRMRRKPAEIERKYKCLFPGCTKAYGVLPHLNTHIVDSVHGEKWSKVDYLEASKQVANIDGTGRPETRHGGHLPTALGQGDMINLDDSLAEERHAEDTIAKLRRNQEQVNRAEKIRQRDRRAKEAMEREEMMELMNNV
jgi:hypothetical protein